ncbi:MAG TPA: hypothetical protein VMT52_08000, partial [Planctomycetota bacterium]|nr:hypothetical protein [Planctomycetota bacterium]
GAAREAEERAVTDITRYMTASWRSARFNSADWADLTQEAFAELLGRIPRDRLPAAIEESDSGERRELNRSVWCAAQRWRRVRRHASLEGLAPPAAPDAPSSLDDAELVEHLQTIAERRLSGRQRRILSSWCEGESVGEIARDLGISSSLASNEKYKAIQRVRGVLAGV